MKSEKNLLKQYLVPFVAAITFLAFTSLVPEKAPQAYSSLLSQIGTMFFVIPPIFLLLGLLDVWVPKETFIKYLGTKSGFKGKVIAFALGSAAAGPLYGAFPVAAVLMKKGADFDNILILIGAWSTTKLPMLLFEMESLGVRFALARLVIDIPGIILIAAALKRFVPRKVIERVYVEAEQGDAAKGRDPEFTVPARRDRN